MKLAYDLHIHSALSPCGDNDMTPNNIVNMAYIKELDVISVTDHNSILNVNPIIELSKKYDIIVIPGMEVTTKEEIHTLCYFRSIKDAVNFNTIIYESLSNTVNNELIFGEQLIMDKNDKIVSKENKLLINSSILTVDEVVDLVKKFNGVVVPAHIDKLSNSIVSTLGFIPENLSIKSIEFSKHKNQNKVSEYLNYNIFTNSDAHYLTDINERTQFLDVDYKSIDEIFKALDK